MANWKRELVVQCQEKPEHATHKFGHLNAGLPVPCTDIQSLIRGDSDVGTADT